MTLGETKAWGAQSRAGALSDLGFKGLPLRPAEKGLWRRGAGEDGLAAEAPRRGQVPGMFTRTRAQACLASCCNHVARHRVWHRYVADKDVYDKPVSAKNLERDFLQRRRKK